ncbi:hypothetical protein NQ314_018089 [Rhamnusium bicolor]|uniref:Transposase n=1 Tax=Rhamnusium bicolor TaxID=1586634 RepID=A0AAV8WSS3_9CUCU|nr:hypothetical protein NQ314_018089 [Rhamnusium bicolor]
MTLELCLKRKYICDSSSTESSTDENFLESSESDSDSELDERTKRTKMEGFMEKVVPKYSNAEFRSHFRFQRSGVDFVENLVREEFEKKTGHTGGRESISAKTGIHLFLWYIANQETFRQIADRFNVSKRTAHDIIKKVAKKLVDTSAQFIVFPQEEQFPALSEGFRRRNNLVGVIGAVDGCHVPIRKPTKKPAGLFLQKEISQYSHTSCL